MSDVIQANEPPTTCPVGHESRRAVLPSEILELPMRKRMVVQYALNDDGVRELRLFHADKEISFDEPELFAFGETLAQQDRFTAGEAVAWGPGYSWKQTSELLETLLEEGILIRPDSGNTQTPPLQNRLRTSLLLPAPASRPRTWLEIEEVTRDLAGRAVELAYLEAIVPIFRVAHIYLDADGRQVGEANVFPRSLRIEAPTEWMTCVYSGSRYLAEAPMNVTALKSMREHWGQMMVALSEIRRAFVRRCPDASRGFTIGHIERLAASILCVPTFLLMRGADPVPNGSLHPALSSLFRVTDGLRLVMHEMLFVPIGETTRSPQDCVTVQEIHDYAERNFSFHTPTGVCAGPQMLVMEFLRVIVEGHVPERYAGITFDAPVQDALAHADQAMDYAMLGLQTYALTYSLWPSMTRAYAHLTEAVARAVDDGAHALRDASVRLHELKDRLDSSPFLAHESWRADRDAVYADMYEQCGLALAGVRAPSRLAERLRPTESAALVRTRADLHPSISGLVRGARSAQHHATQITQSLSLFLARVHALLEETEATQTHIGQLLNRSAPVHRLNARDIDVHNRLQGEDMQRLPFLLDELPGLFHLSIEIDSTGIRIEPFTLSAAS